MPYIFAPKCKWQKENQTQLTQANFRLCCKYENHNADGTTKLQWKAIRQQLQRDRKKTNKPSQQKPTNEAAVRLKPTNFTIQRTKSIHIRQMKLKHKELNSKA